MNKFKHGFDLPELTDEVASKLRNILYTFIDIFEAHYCHKIERYQRHLLTNTDVLNPNKDQS
jgi:hypothetical protein